MHKYALAALLLASSSSAQIRVSPAPAAWSSAIGIAGGAAGLVKIEALGSVSLPRLLTPAADETVPVFTNPALVAPIAAELEFRGLTPEKFSSLWLAARLGVLSEAAKAVERRAASEASRLAGLSRADAESPEALERIDASARDLRERAIYLGPGAAAALEIVETSVARQRAARVKALSAFYDDLPRILAEEKPGGPEPLVAATRGGDTVWRGADGDPDEAHGGVLGVLESRVASIESLPPGPWTVRQDRRIGAAAEQALRLGRLESPAELKRAKELLERARARHAAVQNQIDGSVGRSARRLLAGRGGLLDVERVEAHYEGALTAARGWREKAHVLAGAWTGSKTFPSWPLLQEKRDEIAARMERIGVIGGRRWILAVLPLLLALIASEFAALPAWALASTAVAPAVMLWASFRRTRAQIPAGSELHRLMGRHFQEKK
ncbi:MAG: hypothetical protein M0D55_19965 [Elusimicrobiota bacterium]|nr:MAG: hypothetical protein M0D55_19965 [Elusimicrobiota bacterium]